MLRIEFGHLILLAVLLLPGVVSGAIVSWKVRSPLSLFFTIGSSLASSFIVSLLGLLFWKLISPFISHLSPNTLLTIRDEYLPWFLTPAGLISGAVLSGMLLLVDYELKLKGKKLNFSSGIIAGIGSSVASSIISLLSIFTISLITEFLFLSFIRMFSMGAQMGLGGFIYIFYGVAGIVALVSIVICGFISAIFGVKLADFLR